MNNNQKFYNKFFTVVLVQPIATRLHHILFQHP